MEAGLAHRDPRPTCPGRDVASIGPPHGDIWASRRRQLASDRPPSTPQAHQGPMSRSAHGTARPVREAPVSRLGRQRAGTRCLVRVAVNRPFLPLAAHPFLLSEGPPGTAARPRRCCVGPTPGSAVGQARLLLTGASRSGHSVTAHLIHGPRVSPSWQPHSAARQAETPSGTPERCWHFTRTRREEHPAGEAGEGPESDVPWAAFAVNTKVSGHDAAWFSQGGPRPGASCDLHVCSNSSQSLPKVNAFLHRGRGRGADREGGLLRIPGNWPKAHDLGQPTPRTRRSRPTPRERTLC